MSELSHGAYGCGKCEQGFDRFNDYMAHGCIEQITSTKFAVETCDQLHKFAFIVGEPKPRCPFCLAMGLDQARREQEEALEVNRQLSNEVEDLRAACEHYAERAKESDLQD